MKKIVVFVTSNLSKWMYKSLFDEQFALKKKLSESGYKVFFFGPGFKNCKNLNFKNYQENYIKNKIDLFILYGGEKFFLNGLSNDEIKFFKLSKNEKYYIKQFQLYKNIKKIIHINDFWHNNKFDWKIIFRLYGITDVLSMYAPFNVSKRIFKNYFEDKNIKFHKYNRAINLKNLSKIKINLKRKRFYDVIMIGAVNKFYPFRVFADKLISKMKNINYKKFEHPGYKFFEKKNNLTIGKKYYSTMENSKIVVTCGTKLNLPIPKIWEIMSTGAILVIDKITNIKNLNLINNKNYIKANFGNLKSKIQYLIKNELIRKKISENAMLYSRNVYSLNNQAKYLNNIIKKIIKRKIVNTINFNTNEIYLLKFKSFLVNMKELILKISLKFTNLSYLK